jgi:hypothetical protein
MAKWRTRMTWSPPCFDLTSVRQTMEACPALASHGSPAPNARATASVLLLCVAWELWWMVPSCPCMKVVTLLRKKEEERREKRKRTREKERKSKEAG